MEKENYPSNDFLAYWHSEVEPVAMKCAPHFRLIMDVENGKIDPNAPETAVLANVKDLNAEFFIGHMISDVNRAAIKGIRLDFLNSLGQIQGTLRHGNTSYWGNVWNNDFSSEEAQNLRKLGDLMEKLVSRLSTVSM